MDDVVLEDICREYVKIQRDIVSGRLICSKEEAAALAALQLRLEVWPEENFDLVEGKFHTSFVFFHKHPFTFI